MQVLSQPITIPVSEHPEVVIPQELRHVVEKGSDAQELKIEKDGNINLPLTYEQALKKKDTTRFGDSMHWLAAFIMYQWMKYDPDVVRAVKAKTKT
jgi:hypothetical protein